MCVYVEGEGEQTLVFLSGSGTASPILDFKSIYNRLSKDYRIVVIEKFGYGFSDISESERDFDTILRQDRKAIELMGLQGPFILCPHSMSGIEAIMWAQQYPKEVAGVVGLDMATPQAYEKMQLTDDKLKLMFAVTSVTRELGILRLVKDETLISSPVLSTKEKQLYRKIVYAKMINQDVQNEALHVNEACEEIQKADQPQVPMLLFASDGSGGTGLDTATWRGVAYNYASGNSKAKVVELDCPHYVHNFATDQVEKEIRTFLK